MSSSWGDIPAWAFSAAQALMQTLKVVDPGTFAHCCRVGEMARKLSRDAGLNEYEQKLAEFAGLFHDIGKMGVPPSIIAKPGKLDDSEHLIMQSHPVLSEEIVKPLAHHEFFASILPGIRGHHERMDGRGYPDKTLGEEIPLVARIILVVDTYDAMSQTRAYRKGLPDEVIYAELQRCAGTQFDPRLVKIFLDAHDSWKKQGADPETWNYVIKKAA